ncbi:MAG: tetratricopeptide repeat protein [Rhodospirillales bacterium]|nr:MAG: tetratricopeptide repeat protein [Rhodospirillales bacterium]
MDAKNARIFVVGSFVMLAAAAAVAVGVDLMRRGPIALAQSPRGGETPPAPRARPPQSVDGFFLAGRAAEAQRDYEAAHGFAEQALRRAPDQLEVQLLAFRLRLLTGRAASAAELAPRLLEVSSTDGLSNLAMAVAAIKRGDFKGAEPFAAKLGEDSQIGLLRPFTEAWLKVGQKDFAAARAKLAQVKPAASEGFQAVYKLHEGLLEEQAGDRAAAEARLREAARDDDSGVQLRAILALAGVMRRGGRADEAREVLRTYGERNADAVVMEAAARGDGQARPPTPAEMIAEVLADIGGAMAAGGTARRESAEDVGLIFALLALDLAPALDGARLLTGEIHETMGQHEKAIAHYAAVDRASPLQWRARLRAAAALAETGKFDEAAQRLQAMVAERPERIDAAAALGDLHRTKDRFAESVKAYDTAIGRVAKVEERHWSLFYTRGIALERIKDWPRAEADFKRALALLPPTTEQRRRNRAFVLNYLGYSWIDQAVNLDEGLKLLKEAVNLVPDDGAITDSLGWGYYRLGKFDEAVELLEKAIQLKADDATIVEHLGDAYWHVGRKREARFQWERALNQKPEAERVDPLRRKLVEGLTPELDKPTVIAPAEKK